MNLQVMQIAQRIRELREISQKDIAAMAQITGVTVEQYKAAEAGESDFSFMFLQNIAKALGVDIIELITGDSPKLSGFEIVRKGEGIPLERRRGFQYMHLAGMFKDKMAEPFMVTAKFDPKAQEQDIPIGSHQGEEFNLVVKGRLKIQLGSAIEILEEGDSVYYNSLIPHGMIALDQDCLFLAVVLNPQGDALAYQQPVIQQKAAQPLDAKQDGEIFYEFATPHLNAQGILQDIEFHPPENFNFGYDVVDRVAEKYPDKTAMLWVSRDQQERAFTFSQISRLSNQCANYFLQCGIQKGDKVMLVLKRHYQFWIAIIALHKIGAIVIPATNLLVKKDFEYRFNAAGVSAIVCTADGDVAAQCDAALPACPQLKLRMIANGKREGWRCFDEEFIHQSESLQRIDTHKDDIMLMYFTSGTTGYPKIAAHSHTYPLGHLVTAKYWHHVQRDGLHFTIADTGWGKAVWGKLYGQWLCEAAVFTYDFDRFEASDILTKFAKYRITTFCAPPTMYRFFIKEDLSAYDLSSLVHVSIAGEALNPEVFEQFYKATGLKPMEGFGQTETTLTVLNLYGTEPKPGSMGKPNPQYDTDIINAQGQSAKSGEVGEIVVRTDKRNPCGMFLGYYLDPEKTKEAWHDGIYHTGDMAWRDEDGYFWYVGRTDDLIKSSGYRIGPFEIESVIMELPYVIECAVTGVPDPVRGQLVKATIVLVKNKQPSDALIKEIQDYVKAHTAPYKYPRVIEFVDALPKTISGKIRRVELRNA